MYAETEFSYKWLISTDKGGGGGVVRFGCRFDCGGVRNLKIWWDLLKKHIFYQGKIFKFQLISVFWGITWDGGIFGFSCFIFFSFLDFHGGLGILGLHIFGRAGENKFSKALIRLICVKGGLLDSFDTNCGNALCAKTLAS